MREAKDPQTLRESYEGTVGVVGRRCHQFEQPPLLAPTCRSVRWDESGQVSYQGVLAWGDGRLAGLNSCGRFDLWSGFLSQYDVSGVVLEGDLEGPAQDLTAEGLELYDEHLVTRPLPLPG